MADKTVYFAYGLIGGGANDLDFIDGSVLLDQDVAHVYVGDILYIYILDDDSGAGESSPTIISPDANAGTKRWILQHYRSIEVGSDADGDIYYRASSVLAALAKGAADTKLFINAGATAPEWAAGIYMGTFSYDLTTATGTQAITGLGFKPNVILFVGAIHGVADVLTIAMSQSTTEYNVSQAVGATVTFQADDNTAMYFETANGDRQIATISVIGADGFTVSWIKDGTPTGTAKIRYIAWR